jgi:hypothetical protein
MNQRQPTESTSFRPTLQFSAGKAILNKGQRRLILRREVASTTLADFERRGIPKSVFL